MHQSFSTMAGEVAECGIYKEKARCLSELLAVWTGLEPATPCVTGRYSNQLNYHTVFLCSSPGAATFTIFSPLKPALLNHRSDSECKGKHNFQISKLFTEIFQYFLCLFLLFTLHQLPDDSLLLRLSLYMIPVQFVGFEPNR